MVENMHNRDRCLEGFCLMFVVLAAIVTGSSLAKPLSKVIYDRYGTFDNPAIHFNVHNKLNTQLKHSKVYVSFPELGADAYTRSLYSFDVQPNEVRSQFLIPEFGSAMPAPGWYYARVGFSTDKFRDVRYVPIYLG